MTPLRATAHSTVRNGVLILVISSLALAGFGESAYGQDVVRPPTSVSHPPKIHVAVSSGDAVTDTVTASPVITQYDGSRLISKTFETRVTPILEVSRRDTSLEISAPALPQFVQIESAAGISTSSTPLANRVIDKCGPTPALDLLSHCTSGHEANGQWKWTITIPAVRLHSPYLIVYVRWVTNRKNGPSVIYLGLWKVLIQRHEQNTVTYAGG
jgi:hypothetical protein